MVYQALAGLWGYSKWLRWRDSSLPSWSLGSRGIDIQWKSIPSKEEQQVTQ